MLKRGETIYFYPNTIIQILFFMKKGEKWLAPLNIILNKT